MRNKHLWALGQRVGGLTGLMLLSPIIGFVSDLLLVNTFGVGRAADIFRLCFSFMVVGSGVMAGYMMRYGILPEYARFKARGDDKGAFLFALGLACSVLLLLAPLTIACVGWPENVLSLLAPGFSNTERGEWSPLIQAAGIGLTFLLLSSSINAVLQYYDVVHVASLGQALLNIILCIGFWVLAGSSQKVSYILAEILIASAMAPLIVSLIMGRRVAAKHQSLVRHVTFVDLTRVGKLVAVTLGSQIIVVVAELLRPMLVNRALSELDEGSIFGYNFAMRMVAMAFLPALAVGMLALPRFVHTFGRGDYREGQKLFRKGIMAYICVMGGISGLLCLLSPLLDYVIMTIMPMSGHISSVFSMTFRVLVLGLLGMALYSHALQAAYATGKAVYSVVASIVNVTVLAAVLALWQGATSVQIAAIYVAVSSVVAFGFCLVMDRHLCWSLRIRGD